MKKNYFKKVNLKPLMLLLVCFYGFTAYAQFPDPYCPVSYTNTIEPITLVQFAGIDNSTTATLGVAASPGHENFTSMTGNVMAGLSYPITLNGNTDGNFTNYFRVYVDWNQNGVFTDPGESHNIGTIYANNGSGTPLIGSIAVPPSAAEGTTRMRVMKLFNAYPAGPCSITGGFGQTEDYTLEVTLPDCTHHQATFAINSLCDGGNDEFEIVTSITDLGSATSLTISDNQGNTQSASATGTVILGPYQNLTSVIITVTNDADSNCAITSQALTQTLCNETCANATNLANKTSPLSSTTVGASNTNLSACNNSGGTTVNTYPDVYYYIMVPNGSTLTIGQTVNNYDSTNVIFYGDCDNRTQIDCFDDPDEKIFVWANDTGSDQNVYWIQDGHSGSGTFTLAWSVVACTNPTATYAVNSLCESGAEEFEIITTISDLGSANSVTVSDNQGNSQNINATGPVVLGPYPNSTSVVITVTNNEDNDCTISSGNLTQTLCNVSCANAIDLTNETSPLSGTTVGYSNDNLSACNNSGGTTVNTYPDVYYSIMVPNGSTLSIGQTTNNYDSTNIVFYGDCDNRTQIDCFDDPDEKIIIWANDTGSDQTVYWIQDGHSGSGTFSLAWSVVACTNPTATFAVNSLCESEGDGFEVVTEITSLGSANSVTVSDNQGNSESVSTLGPVALGPYSNNTPVIISVTNNDDNDCVITSGTLNQLQCPPVNDDATGAIVLTLDEGMACGTNAITAISNAATTPSSEEVNPTCSAQYNPSYGNGDLWFKFEAPSNEITLNVTSIVGISSVSGELYSGTPGSLTPVGTCGNAWPKVYTTLTPNETYYLRAWDYGNDDIGTFTLCGYYLSCTNPTATFTRESLCENGEEGFNVIVNVTNLGSASSVNIEDNQGNTQSASSTGTVTFGPYANATSVIVKVINQDNNACSITSASITQQACPAANDSCSEAIELTVGQVFNDQAVQANNINASNDASDPVPTTACDGLNFATTGKDVWFSIAVPASGSVTIETAAIAGSTLTDTGLEVHSGTCGAISLLGCSADISTTAPINRFSRVALTDRTPGEIVLARVFGYNGTSGTFMISAYDSNLENPSFEASTLKVYPNPVKDILNLSHNQNISEVGVFNMLGQQVMAKSINASQGQIDMSNLATGNYLIRIASDNIVKTIKVVKQ